MERPRAVIRFLPALLLSLCGCALLFSASQAVADPYEPPALESTEPAVPGVASCPDGPAEPFEGEDVAAGETRALRADLAAVCTALRESVDGLSHRTWWVVAEQLRASKVLATVLEELSMQLPAVNGNLESINGHLVEVRDAASEGSPLESAEVVEAVDAGAEGNMAALYLIAGLVVSCFVGYCLWRTVSNAT